MRIVSASRRTDIPAFYSEWFVNRVTAGFVRWRNPFSGREHETSLLPEDVAAIVFWSKNYAPLLPHLPGLHNRGYRFLFHFTITGLPREIEPNVPPADDMVEAARQLADRFGPGTVLWRYDPIFISSVSGFDHHRRTFARLSAALEGSTSRCYFSFPAFYAKVIRNTAVLEREDGVGCCDLPVTEKVEFANELAGIASAHGITMHTCCGDYLIGDRIKKAHCVDGELLFRLYPDRVGNIKLKPSRSQCGCYESTDIGAYDTCPHGCVYCYANTNKQTAVQRHSAFSTESEAL
jgi:hypothetical protein